ncbi:Hypothetical predicted protein [Octopus vulgaris]|uniref:Uncharacterized protein n=1 Tax=Octopus vulgaris TaxID=6645 RepID=A0AA36FA99_OCTVU|nr:Hypothetical predicted protein [Octopus vulgaris]
MFMGSLPTFTGDATLWFSQLEAQFRAQSITPEQQLEILYGCMPPQLASSARDLITDPSPGATYASVRLEVEKRNTRSEESRFNELMADEQLGDRTPSEFLRRLRELSGNASDAPLLRKIFFSRLPAYIQTVLATGLETNTVDQIATMVEFAVQPSSRSACACSQTSSASIEGLSKLIETLTKRMDAMTQAEVSCREWTTPIRNQTKGNNIIVNFEEGPSKCDIKKYKVSIFYAKPPHSEVVAPEITPNLTQEFLGLCDGNYYITVEIFDEFRNDSKKCICKQYIYCNGCKRSRTNDFTVTGTPCTTPSTKHKENSSKLTISLAIIGAMIILVLLALSFYCFKLMLVLHYHTDEAQHFLAHPTR